jgi:hypothetical protein
MIEKTRSTTTTAPVDAANCSTLQPEFARVSDCQRLFGLRRSYIYLLISAGKIKSVCLRKPSAKTGVRLIHVQSVRDLLLKELDGGTKERDTA